MFLTCSCALPQDPDPCELEQSRENSKGNSKVKKHSVSIARLPGKGAPCRQTGSHWTGVDSEQNQL